METEFNALERHLNPSFYIRSTNYLKFISSPNVRYNSKETIDSMPKTKNQNLPTKSSLKQNLNNLKHLVNLDSRTSLANLKRTADQNLKNQMKKNDENTIYQNSFFRFTKPINFVRTIKAWPSFDEKLSNHQFNLDQKKWSAKENLNRNLIDADQTHHPDYKASHNQLSILSQKSPKFKTMNLMKRMVNDEEGEEEQVDLEAFTTTTRKPKTNKQKQKEIKQPDCGGDNCDSETDLNRMTTNKTQSTKQTAGKQQKVKNQKPYKSIKYRPNGIRISSTPLPDIPPDIAYENYNPYVGRKLPHRSTMPFFAKFLIFLVIIGFISAIFYLCLRKWFKKFWRSDRTRASGLTMAGNKLDMKNVQLLGQAYKEKVSFR